MAAVETSCCILSDVARLNGSRGKSSSAAPGANARMPLPFLSATQARRPLAVNFFIFSLSTCFNFFSHLHFSHEFFIFSYLAPLKRPLKRIKRLSPLATPLCILSGIVYLIVVIIVSFMRGMHFVMKSMLFVAVALQGI